MSQFARPVVSAFLKATAGPFDDDNTNRTAILRTAGVLILGSLIAACSASPAEPEVVLEAHWQCGVQRLSFVDMSDLNAEVEARITSAGMTVEECNTFKIQLSSSEDLRSSVETEYERYCQEQEDR